MCGNLVTSNYIIITIIIIIPPHYHHQSYQVLSIYFVILLNAF